MSEVQKHSHVEVVVDATVPQVWSVVSDVTRVGEWSHECRGAEWLGDADGPCHGRPLPRPQQGGPGGVGTMEPDLRDRLAWTLLPRSSGARCRLSLIPDSTEWRIRLEPADRGTRITQTFEVVRATRFHDRLFSRLIPSHQDRDARLTDDLRRIGEVARAGARL